MSEPSLVGYAFGGMPLYAGWSGSKFRPQSKPLRWMVTGDDYFQERKEDYDFGDPWPMETHRFLPLFQWPNPGIKDHWGLLTRGVAGQWTIARTTGRDYFDQMTAEVRQERVDTRGRIKVLWVLKRRDNHYLDCEPMLHVAAIISGVLKTLSPTGAANADS